MIVDFFEDHLRKDTLLSHVVLHGLGSALAGRVAECDNYKDGKGQLDLKLTVEGHEIDIESFVDHWQSQVGEIIKREAAELVENKARESMDALEWLGEQIRAKTADLGYEDMEG